ncbi:hypothetical protein [Tepidibacter mesophilus]|uniref:hypothetical protein n=1 Tax=Tepidibacter mesophilus TaxID=655607 RepID=UPI000C06A66B|nr:hypothetical protein [Tepidibacter mesophilus]
MIIVNVFTGELFEGEKQTLQEQESIKEWIREQLNGIMEQYEIKHVIEQILDLKDGESDEIYNGENLLLEIKNISLNRKELKLPKEMSEHIKKAYAVINDNGKLHIDIDFQKHVSEEDKNLLMLCISNAFLESLENNEYEGFEEFCDGMTIGTRV